VTTPQRGILEMLIIALLVNKFTVFYRTRDNLLPFSLETTITVIVYGVVSHKASHTLRPSLIYCASPSDI
jgi:Na+/serine symporter